MELVERNFLEYDFYLGSFENKRLYNIVKTGEAKPAGGYLNMRYIEKIKHVNFPERY
jgi:hypothetical protein